MIFYLRYIILFIRLYIFSRFISIVLIQALILVIVSELNSF